MSMRVVVIGAGFAGLRAAEDLRAGGCDVVVVEGGPRPGGRVRTVSAPFAGGQYSESGAEWVDAIHGRMLELLDRFGVERLGPGEQWTTIRRWLHHQGRLLSPDQVRVESPQLFDELAYFDAIVDDATVGLLDPASPQLHPDAAAIDAQSLADVAQRAQLGELAGLFKWRDAQGEFAAEPAQVSLLFVAQQRAYHAAHSNPDEVVLSHRVRGGFGQLAVGMAADLGECITFNEHLVAIEQDVDSVTVHTDHRVLPADHVVLACSLVPLRSVHFRTPLPAALHAAVHQLGYGTVTKTAVQWPQRQWPGGYATTSGRAQRVYEPTIDQPGEQGILMSYCGGDGGREWAALPEPERIELAAREMQEMHGLTAHPMSGYSRAWSNEGRYGGSYAVYQPGQVTSHWQVLREPWGRVHLAGEHVAACTGYMEGALESGETVAARLLGAS
jgi:monoamine oxidase